MKVKLEFTRETTLPMYYAWFAGYVKSSVILGLDMEKVKKAFAVRRKGILKGYTQVNNLSIQKDAIRALDKEKLKEIIEHYLKDYEKFLEDNKKAHEKDFLSSLMSGFVITFILGDMMDHTLQQEGYNARVKTEKIMYMLTSVFGEGEKGDFILTVDKKIPLLQEEVVEKFLKDSEIEIEK